MVALYAVVSLMQDIQAASRATNMYYWPRLDKILLNVFSALAAIRPPSLAPGSNRVLLC